MRKTFKYRIYPTSKQERALNTRLESCRLLYNKFLSERKNSWEHEQKPIRLYDQINQLPLLKLGILNLKDVYGQALQNVAVRVDLAFQAFFRRVKAGGAPGYPRFKAYGRYDSITYPLYGRGVKIVDNRIRVTGIGHIKLAYHREILGAPKTATIKKSSTGKWYVSFSCEIEKPEPLPTLKNSVGVDVGLETFAYFSDENRIENPRFFKKEEKELEKVQRKLDKVSVKDKNGKVLNGKDPIRFKAKKVVSRVHERIGFKRQNFAHQESRKIINNYQIICVEDLKVNKLKEHTFRCIAKSISDAGWSMFTNTLSYKAVEAGRTVVFVNPAYTSQDCSRCGHREKKALSERMHLCKCCGLNIHRDLNASINIESLGLQALGVKALEAPCARTGE